MTTSAPNTTDKKPARKKRVCPRCKGEMDTRIPRGFVIKTFFPWLPVRRYMCYKCQRKKYVWVDY